jgi:hypothetical protein
MPEYRELAKMLLDTTPFHTGEVHAQDTSSNPAYATYELLSTKLQFDVPYSVDDWAERIQPNRTWADEHFAERVSGEPCNPAPSHERWPFAHSRNADHVDDSGKFSHTYPERFWPKFAGQEGYHPDSSHVPNFGIRYQYGDLEDIVSLLVKNPFTRQAYLPVWFPEDLTAAIIGKRAPCSIGYHFMIRDGFLHCWYTMRSCDFLRYLRDDIYMAGLLMRWVCYRVNKRTTGEFVIPGTLHLSISSLHAFVGDRYFLNKIANSHD